MDRVKVGIVGCGMISEIYLKNMTTVFDTILEAYACADLNPAAAQKRAEQFGLRAMSVEELLADPQVEIVLDLTIPAAHADIGRKALLAGKHHYSEKPLAIRYEDGVQLLELAEEKGLYAVSAPDTFLGGGLQTCRKLLEDGAIGQPVFAQGMMISRGPETFHPNPKFFYEEGAGPLMDMGPYYYTALLSLFGPAARVSGSAKCTLPSRTALAESSPYHGQQFPCEVDTFISGTIDFVSGMTANVTTCWDLPNAYWESGLPLLQVFGTKGMLILPDPNTFGGICNHPMREVGTTVKLRRGDGPFEEIPVMYGYTENSRCLGLADLAWCIRTGEEPRITPGSSLHVLEMMLGVLESSRSGSYHQMQTTCKQPQPMYDNVPFRKV